MSERKRTDLIVIHCSATPPENNVTAKDIDRWHRAEGWTKIGYHFVIKRDGVVETGRDLLEIGAHCFPPAGINSRSVGVCLVGGISDAKTKTPENNFTEVQWESLKKLVEDLRKRWPATNIVGHRDLSHDRACPSFEVSDWVKANGFSIADIFYSPPLRLGSRGSNVVELQKMLNIQQTGLFGPTTQQTVIKFQEQHGLTADGVVGKHTWQALKGK